MGTTVSIGGCVATNLCSAHFERFGGEAKEGDAAKVFSQNQIKSDKMDISADLLICLYFILFLLFWNDFVMVCMHLGLLSVS